MKNNAKNRAAIYVRYSGDPNYSSKRRQLEACRRFAGTRGLKIVHEYVDARHSVGHRRPQFEHMVIDAKAGRFDFVVTENIDRITRNLVIAITLNKILDVPLLIVSDNETKRSASSGIDETRKKRHRQKI